MRGSLSEMARLTGERSPALASPWRYLNAPGRRESDFWCAPRSIMRSGQVCPPFPPLAAVTRHRSESASRLAAAQAMER